MTSRPEGYVRPTFVASLALVAALACVRHRDVRVQADDAPAVPDSIFVSVINDNYYDARVHVVYDGGARHSLGTVAGNQRQAEVAMLWQPRALFVEVTLIIGGGVFRSDRIDVSPGGAMEVRIPPDLNASGFFRRVSR